MNKRRLMTSLAAALRSVHCKVLQPNPFLPDVLNQPEFLIVPDFGRLVAVYVYAPRRRLGWRHALAMVEDLFEIKQATGDSTASVGIFIPAEPMSDKDAIYHTLLHNLFDSFLTVPDGEVPLALMMRDVAQMVAGAAPRQNLSQLWRSERARISRNLAEFSEERYTSFVDTGLSSRFSKSRIIRELKAQSMDEFDLSITERYEVRSPKEALAGLPERNKFLFDFGVESIPTGRTRPVDVAVLGRYGSRSKLRYLMTKARLTHYMPLQGELMLRDEQTKPVLMVSGNLAGPEHDPFRYVRALVSVGWELVHATPESMREVAFANI
jgi:hypothetical protein